MHFALKYFRYDKTGVKKCIYTVCEKITPKTMFPFSTISYHVSLTDKRNYLNNDHTKWNHPCLKREIEQYKQEIGYTTKSKLPIKADKS